MEKKGHTRNRYFSYKNRRYRTYYPSPNQKTTMAEVDKPEKPGKDPGTTPQQQEEPQQQPPVQQVLPHPQSPKQASRRDRPGYEVKARPQYTMDIRDRLHYVIPMVLDRLCPKKGYKYYMAKLDEVLEVDKKIEYYLKKNHDIVSEVHGTYGLPVPHIDHQSERHKMQYNRLVCSFQEIKRQLSSPGIEDKSEFNTLTAALEAIGTIMLNPRILYYTENQYEAKEQAMIPRLQTKLFTTPWTYERIEHLSWRAGEDGVEVRKNEIGDIILSTERVEDPGKDPTAVNGEGQHD